MGWLRKYTLLLPAVLLASEQYLGSGVVIEVGSGKVKLFVNTGSCYGTRELLLRDLQLSASLKKRIGKRIFFKASANPCSQQGSVLIELVTKVSPLEEVEK